MDTALSVTGSTVDSTLQNYAGAVELMDRMMWGQWRGAGASGVGGGAVAETFWYNAAPFFFNYK